MSGQNNFLDISKVMSDELKKIPKIWDGKNAISEMKNNNFNQWKQMEWIGFYFEFLCKTKLKDVMEIPFNKKYGNVTFDGFYDFPWDFKAHTLNSGPRVVVNDSEATSNAISEYGQVGLILARGIAQYDNEERKFQKWHQEIKGGESEYEKKRIRRGASSRLRKTVFDLQDILFIRITNKVLMKCNTFQKNFRNAGGAPRREKILLDLEQTMNDVVHSISF